MDTKFYNALNDFINSRKISRKKNISDKEWKEYKKITSMAMDLQILMENK